MKKILVANRGEIAIRVMKTAQKMGIKTVAVFSTADRNAPHVKFADEAVCIGQPPSNQSYLKGDKIIEVAKQLDVDAIHPGYGFLSENAAFAELCETNNIIFIGPKSKAIKIMGSKLAAKDAVKAYNIPMVPGIDKAITDVNKAKDIAKTIGFPILIKASAGGGGKGMRVVEKESELESQMKRAISEATSAFGDGSVFIEKYVSSPRHIEIQVMADSHGNVLHFFERECSIQRRHQKVVEEAPSCILTPQLRDKMGEAAIKVAKACDYLGAGTVEFLLDSHHNFYFLEMNTRLQVEHPVTELITGVDLVELQIKVARGEALQIEQNDLKINGHALELRVYAENPLNDFLPSVGHLDIYKIPEGEGIRVDNGFEEGMDIPIYYDPMLSKLITFAKTREEAIQLMIKAIENYHVKGIETTLPFGKYVCEHEAFRSGNFDTHFVKNYYSPEALKAETENEAKIAALIAVKQYIEDQKLLRLPIK
ncbi:acetyl-CoA carboxylase biotin carboxylase subunit [Algibacter amylolyticus]|uniref:Acetyl-CoA carboxylase biotin carboxylase subunit n=1 Tax=Algibacter amylolyticus TaxID=1608400 RepID=A0A5M7B5F4_9FLAO|nr:acetyl-CoA carboxylase biotin carboxylase subunit [Algibacter amylolyticus]KAA5823608.1 acetyl-CoA carboxylase biotin carboxylase subunit [Algibacter amylolyticus]MBB5267767.1 propionyl-CoA carboxylase alpha chain [Algibacter amylolyticus]TSJ74096.1 acetyl-CoA carboxylase biotin carboxylase subunit [Algibacter amylolyticus]